MNHSKLTNVTVDKGRQHRKVWVPSRFIPGP
jgi:hypothetical protein